jgi:isoleucyl-tRNA synthetase
VLEILCKLSAPFIPHLAEAIHRQLSGQPAGSVHVAGWPAAEPLWEDPELVAQMALVQRLARLGHAARSEAGIEQDLLLPKALVGLLPVDETLADRLVPYAGLLAEALAVDEARVTPDAATHVEWQLALDRDRTIARYADPAEIDAALERLNPEEARTVASQLLEGLSVSVESAGRAITLLPEEVIVTLQPEPGWAAAVEGTYLVILETGSAVPA